MPKRARSVLWVCLIMAGYVFLLAGCGRKSAKEPGMVFEKNGSIRVTNVENFSAPYYSEKELEQIIDEGIAAYDGEIKKESLSVDHQTAYLTMTYRSADLYSDYNDVFLFYGSVKEAQQQGIDLTPILGAVSAKQSMHILTASKLQDLSDNILIVVSETGLVTVPRPVLYMSANVTAGTKKNTCRIQEAGKDSPAILILDGK